MIDKLWVQIADTPYKQAQGLMFIEEMPFNEGMLFSFAKSEVLKFWGENTYISLDIAFADDKGVIRKLDRIRPFDRVSKSSGTKCKYAIEANEGFFAKNNIGVGDSIRVRKDDKKGYFVEFILTRKDIMRESQVVQEEIIEDPRFDQDLPVIDLGDLENYLEDTQEEKDKILETEPIGLSPPNNFLFPNDQFRESPIEEELPTGEEEPVFDAVKDAELNTNVMIIQYVTDSGKFIEREIEPHGTFRAKSTNREILVAFDRTVEGIRAYILQNITGFSFTGEEFKKRFLVK